MNNYIHRWLKIEGSWWEAKVLDLDASLALLQFVGTNKQEWIYRGSTRIYLLYQQLQAADRRALAPGRHRPSGTIASRPTSKLVFSIYCNLIILLKFNHQCSLSNYITAEYTIC